MTEDKTISNVLLLTMSTLSFKKDSEGKTMPLSENYYKYKDICVSGYGQLEPIPKMLIQKIKDLDEIIIIASNDSRKEIDFEIEIRNPDGTIYTEMKRESAVSFFIEQLTSVKSDLLFKVIEIKKSKNSEDNILIGSIEEVVDELRTLKNKNADLTLYLDMHGGQRQNQLVMDAIISLLKLEDIKVTETYSCDGYSNDINNPKEIQKADEALKIFDFVAGMNEFINYGSSKSLEKYILESESVNEDIINSIANISNSLRLCDIEGFEKELDKMKDILVENETDGYIDIFKKAIESDYKDLLDKKNRNLISELDWALKKGFIQQCLAIVESKSAGYFVNLFIKPGSGHVCNKTNRGNVSFNDFFMNNKKDYDSSQAVVLMNYIVNSATLSKHKGISVQENVFSARGFKGYTVSFEYENIDSEEIIMLINLWTAIKKIRNMIMHSAGLKVKDRGVNRLLGELIENWNKRNEENKELISTEDIENILNRYIDIGKKLITRMDKEEVCERLDCNADIKVEQIFIDSCIESIIGKEYEAKIVRVNPNGITWIKLIDCSEDDIKDMHIQKGNPGDGIIRDKIYNDNGRNIKVKLVENGSQCVFEIIK